VAKSYAAVYFNHGDFLNIDIWQGSVAIQLRCGKVFKYKFVANFPLSPTVKEF